MCESCDYMDQKTNVFVRGQNVFHKVAITSEGKPDIEKATLMSWQRIVDLIAKVFDVPAGLIMRITNDSMVVVSASNTENNPYRVGASEQLGNGVYCETVIGTNNHLKVVDATCDEVWKDNPDVKLGFTSYYGIPIKWPDKEIFGTICVLDDKPNTYKDVYIDLLEELRFTIEKDLDLLYRHQILQKHTDTDVLTSVYNRGKMELIIQNEYERTSRSGVPFSVAIIDMDFIKDINDTYGHDVGDRVLKVLATGFDSRIRSIDSFGRWGGDEFLLVCPNTDRVGMRMLFEKIYDFIVDELSDIVRYSSFSYGISEYYYKDASYVEVVKRADKELYKAKTLRG